MIAPGFVGPLVFEVEGRPAPKGSPNVVTHDKRTGRPLKRPRVLRDTPATDAWHAKVGWAARRRVQDLRIRGLVFSDVPLVFEMVAFLPRPKEHYFAGLPHFVAGRLPPADSIRQQFRDAVPAVKPDFDKLLRSTADPLKGIVYDEDSRIVDGMVYKRYANHRTGAVLVIHHYEHDNYELRGPLRGERVG